MPIDAYFNESGDIQVSPSGDIALTPTPYRNVVQQAYIRVMTDQGDYVLYPDLGASLSKLYGMPQSAATGAYGERLIMTALTQNGGISGAGQINVKSVPTDYNTIRFDITISAGSLQQIKLSVAQNLAFTSGS